MPTVTHLVATPNTAISPLTSGAFTPTANDLLVAFVVASGTVETAGTMTGSTGLTFAKAGQGSAWSSSSNVVHCFVAGGFAGAVSQTVTFDSTADITTGQTILVMGVSGMVRYGVLAVRQLARQDNIAGPSAPAPVFAAACLTENPVLGCLGVFTNPPAATPPSGWTEGADTGFATPATGCETAFISSGFTSTTPTWGSSHTDYGSLAVELDSSPALQQIGVKRPMGVTR